MIDQTRFDLIRRKHSSYASWAVWAPTGGRPKSNVGNLDVLDPEANSRLLEVLNHRVVMVGLNISRQLTNEPFRNFHYPGPSSNGFKLRFAFEGTPYWGAYMTDIIKDSVESQSERLIAQLKSNPGFVRVHIETLRGELRDLGEPKPLILALGREAHARLSENLSAGEYSQLVRLTHYSHRMPKERYRETVHQEIRSQLATA